MAKKDYSGSIALTKLIHVPMTKKGKDGKEVKGIFIPYEPNFNYLTVVEKDGKVGLYMDVSIRDNGEKDNYDNDGWIAQRASSKLYKEATEEQKEEMKKLPFVGNIRTWEQSANDASGAVGAGKTFSEDDDLPF